jgi:hypothetical protein
VVLSAPQGVDETTHLAIASGFLDGLTARHYTKLAAALDPDARFRAMLPGGPSEWHGPTEIADTFRGWFGSADDFEVLGTVVGDVAGRVQMTWRFRLRPAPFDVGEGWHLIEQHAFADLSGAIVALDLVCSGFRAEPTQP